VQTYTADTLTIDCDLPDFVIKGGQWDGRTLYDLYSEASMPWDWQPRLKEVADSIGINLFSTPFDVSAVDFLEDEVKPDRYKVSSFCVGDAILLERIYDTEKPVIISCGTVITETVKDIRQLFYDTDLTFMHCVSAYPASPEAMNLSVIDGRLRNLGNRVGLSDHSLSTTIPALAVALGATVIEKHMMLSAMDAGPDSDFSLCPEEFADMVGHIREAEAALGGGLSEPTEKPTQFCKSVYCVKDIGQGETITADHVRVIRPGYGLVPDAISQVVGKVASVDIGRGEPMSLTKVAG